MLLAARCRTPLRSASFPLAALIRLYELLKNNSRLFRVQDWQTSTAISCLLRFANPSEVNWWRMTGSNRRPPACKAGALPAELIPRELNHSVVGLAGFEPATPALSRRCSNRLSYRPTRSLRCLPAPVEAIAQAHALFTHCCVYSR